jgi:hypothetical protein
MKRPGRSFSGWREVGVGGDEFIYAIELDEHL